MWCDSLSCIDCSLLGVEFTLPLAPDSVTKAEPVGSENLEDSENEDEMTASSWLHSMGLATDDLSTAINSQKIALYPPNGRHIAGGQL